MVGATAHLPAPCVLQILCDVSVGDILNVMALSRWAYGKRTRFVPCIIRRATGADCNSFWTKLPADTKAEVLIDGVWTQMMANSGTSAHAMLQDFIGLVLHHPRLASRLVRAATGNGDALDVLQQHADLNAAILDSHYSGRGLKQASPLLWAAHWGDTNVIAMLAAHGANVNQQSPATGNTPLMTAAYRGHVEVVRALVDLGAGPTIVDQWGQSPLYKAVLGGESSDGDLCCIIELLVRHGADVNHTCNHGKTCLCQSCILQALSRWRGLFQWERCGTKQWAIQAITVK